MSRLVGLILFAWVLVAHAASPCEPAFGRLVSVQGDVDLRRAGADWQAAALDDLLCSGDSVRVQRHARAALQLSNETTLRLDQGTELTMRWQAQDESIQLESARGSTYVITRTPKPFKVRTPFVNASIEGTEFLVRVSEVGARVGVFEGHVVVSNDAGRVDLGEGEEASSVGGAAPVRTLMVRSPEAVEWTLHVPTLLDRREAGANPAMARAEGLLSVGRLDEARPLLQQAAALEPRNATPPALLAVITLVEGDSAGSLRQARTAVELDPASVTARMALSYAQQATFDLDGALATVQAAIGLDPANALAQARAAELQLSLGRVRQAVATAAAAVRLDPAVSKTQTVLGFARLAMNDAAAARGAFESALSLDQADPLPRLGLGLARIRAGDFAAGRADIEIAASLDPARSLIRSYLGKAYYEEKRDKLAARQFALARQADPNDPTPWLYDAIRQQSENDPIGALQALLRSVALNDARAVYRSRLLLDQDRATREVDVAGLLSELTSERAAVSLAAESVTDDPTNSSAHRFLSDAYGRLDRHEVARTSELLQAQMLRPLSLYTASPASAFSDLSLPTTALQSGLFASDAASTFERDRVQVNGGGLVGNRGTSGESLTVSSLQGAWAASAGYFGYKTDGFRPNSDIEHRVGSAFLQFAATPDLSFQMEFRDRRSDFGDLALRFDPATYFTRDRNRYDQTSGRFGITWRPAADSAWLANITVPHSRVGYRFYEDGFYDGKYDIDQHARAIELQYLRSADAWSVVAGGGGSSLHVQESVAYDFTPGYGTACPPEVAPCTTTGDERGHQWNAYAYATFRPAPFAALTVGASRDVHEEPDLGLRRWNPKLGLKLGLNADTTLRLAHFGTLNRTLLTDQTLEPTQVAGFNQLYDETEGSTNRFTLGAIDFRHSTTLTSSIELGRQRQEVYSGRSGPDLDLVAPQRLTSDWVRADLHWLMSRQVALGAGLVVDRFNWPGLSLQGADFPTFLRTERLPLTLRVFPSPLWYGELVVTPIRQAVSRNAGIPTPSGKSDFTVADLSIGLNLPGRAGTVALDVKNLFARKFFYQDDNFRATEVRLSPYLPIRQTLLRAALVF